MAGWDDLRVFHAVAKAGSLSAAARALNLTAATVARRVQELEARLDAKLFDRLVHGYSLTPAGRRIVAMAEDMAGAVRAIEAEVTGEAGAAVGIVRVTASEGLGAAWLAPRLIDLKSAHPGITVELALCFTKSDLSRGEAEVALRLGDPRDDALVGRRIAEASFGLYASREYLARCGAPFDTSDLRRHAIIHGAGLLAAVPQARALSALTEGAPTAARLDSLFAQVEAVRAGLGIAALPAYVAQREGVLARVLAERFDVRVPVWLLLRRDLKDSARVRAVCRFIETLAKRTLCPRDDGSRPLPRPIDADPRTHAQPAPT